MTATYKVFLQEPGGYDMIEASTVYDAEQSTLPRAARERATTATAHFKFPNDELNVPIIKEGAELWAGWVNDSSGDFLPMPRPFGGFIMEVEGYAVGPTHHIHCTLSSYGILFQRATIIGWPTGEDATGLPTAGYPGGLSVADWVNDVVSTYLPGVDTTGIDAVFGTLIWTETNKPGTPDPDFPFPGHWGFTTLDKVLQDLVGGTRAVWPGVEPIYWLEAIGNGPHVIARLRWIDKTDTSGAVKAAFHTDPGPGESWIE